jgi:hypothetical protein
VFHLSDSLFPINLPIVYQVSWLREKARFCQWSEEWRLVGYEMQWMVNWFHWRENQWRQRLRDVNDDERPPGLDSYCHKQIALWGSKRRINSLITWVDLYFGSII